MSPRWTEVRAHLTQTLARPHHLATFQQLRGDPSLAPFRDVDQLLKFLHRPNGTPEAKNGALRALVIARQGDAASREVADACLVLALWPGLYAVRRRLLVRTRRTVADIEVDVLGRTAEAIARLNPERVRWVAATVLRNVERDLIRAHQADTAARADELPEEVPDPASRDWAGPGDRLGRLRSILGEDAALVYAVEVFGLSQKEAANHFGLSYDVARKRHQRAVQRLRDRCEDFC